MFDKVVSARETLITHPGAVLDVAGKVGSAYPVHGGLVSLQVGQPGKVRGRRTVGEFALPSPGDMSASPSSIMTSRDIKVSCEAKTSVVGEGSHTVGFLAWDMLAERILSLDQAIVNLPWD